MEVLRSLALRYLFLLCCWSHLARGGADQRRLLKHLLTDRQHDLLERPVLNDSQTLPVTINLALQQIIEFDGKNQVIVISGWIVLMWHDYSLSWDPKEFGDIETLRIPSTQIWTPDVLLYNSADEKFDSTIKVNAVLQHTGDVLYVPPGIFKSICPFNIASFPFDTQNCTLKFGSWTHDDSAINLTAENPNGQLDAYIKNAEWDLEDFSATSNALKYDCCPTLYPFVLFTIRIRRRSLYYVTNVVVPCFLISCLTILGFLLAPDSGEKLTLQITILLSVVTFSLLISDIMPPSSTAIPIITIYFLCVMCMSTVSVTASVLVISLHFRNAKTYTMPVWIQKYICHYLAWMLRMTRPGHNLTWHAIRRQWAPATKTHDTNHLSASPSASNHVNVLNKQTILFSVDLSEHRAESRAPGAVSPSSKCASSPANSHLVSCCDTPVIYSELRTLVSQLSVITSYIQHQEKQENESQDWKFVAMVIDRLCLILFTVSMAIFTSLTLLSSPSLFNHR